jgi:hypothetical protein
VVDIDCFILVWYVILGLFKRSFLYFIGYKSSVYVQKLQKQGDLERAPKILDSAVLCYNRLQSVNCAVRNMCLIVRYVSVCEISGSHGGE